MKRPVSSSLRNASTFVEHKPCPACRETGGDRAGDNLSVYSDGHGYCNACGHYQKDVTGDNILDIVTANQGSDSVSVLAGNSGGTFGMPVRTPLGSELFDLV